MIIKDHRLWGISWQGTPNQGGELLEPTAIAMHYTAGRSFDRSLEILRRKGTSRSAHVLVGRKVGAIAQLVRFDRQAWHAGVSNWRGRSKCNRFMIGIELENFGKLELVNGLPYAWFDVRKLRGKRVARAGAVPVPWLDTFAAPDDGFFHRYTDSQLDLLERVTRGLLAAYPSLTEIVGHSDIAPGRKIDPGPAFPMERFRALLSVRAA